MITSWENILQAHRSRRFQPPMTISDQEPTFIQKIKDRFGKLFNKPKRFEPERKKHFEILSQDFDPAAVVPPIDPNYPAHPPTPLPPPPGVRPVPPQNPEPSVPGGFHVDATTRPKICPVCRTPNQITRLASGAWKCLECQHTWEDRD